jgi:hypothetical protein
VLGFSNSGCQGGASSTISGVGGGSDNGNVTGNYNVPVGSGNTITAPVSVPVDVCGISGAVAGYANSHCKGGATSTISGVGGNSHNGNVMGNYNVPVLSGNTVTAPISAPVNLCGISLALLGFSNSGCVGGSSSTISGVGGGSHNGNVMGNFNVPVLSGNTVTAPISAPVNVCGVSLALLGFSNSGCQGGSTSCIGDQCAPPKCEGDQCTPPCEGSDCHTPPPCESDCHTPPPCQEHCNTLPPCEDHCNTPPPCQEHCHTPPPCQDNCHTSPPPSCQDNCTPPGPTPPHGTGPGTTTTVTTGTMPSSSLPTTGADLLLLGVAALGSIGVGAGTVALARRRRNGEAS